MESYGYHMYIVHEYLVYRKNALKYNGLCDPHNTHIREVKGAFYIL